MKVKPAAYYSVTSSRTMSASPSVLGDSDTVQRSYVRTDEVVESEKCATELCKGISVWSGVCECRADSYLCRPS